MFGPATGYEIKKLFEDGPFSHFYEASFGSIYPALSKLADDGLISCREERGDGRPDRKIYELTSTGYSQLSDILTSRDPAPDKFRSEFMVLMMFSFMLPQGRIDDLIDQRLATLKQKLLQLSEEPFEDVPASGLFVRDYGRAVMTAEIAYLEANRHRVSQTNPDFTNPSEQSSNRQASRSADQVTMRTL